MFNENWYLISCLLCRTQRQQKERHRSAVFSGAIFLETWGTEEYVHWHFCHYVFFFKTKVYLGFRNDGEDMVAGVWSMDLSITSPATCRKHRVGAGFPPARLCLLELLEPLQVFKSVILWAVFIIPTMRCFMHCSSSFSIGKRGYKIYFSIENNCKWLIHSF